MTEFQEWMEKHKSKFATYDIYEIVLLARTCGFPEHEIQQWEIKSKFNRRAA